jgi:spore coat protein H
MFNTVLRTSAIALFLAALAAGLAACAGPVPAGALPVESASAVPTEAAPTEAASTEAAATEAPAAASQPGDKERPVGWSEESHSNDVDPNYDVVFPVDAVNTITITIAPDDWAAMEADMEDIYAPSLYIRKAILAAGPDLTKEQREKLLVDLFASRPLVPPPGAPPMSGKGELTITEPVSVTVPDAIMEAITETTALTASEGFTGVAAAPARREQIAMNRSPMWVPATISFEGKDWTHVGVRYKGASSLSPWVMGDMKLPFKFDFDQFEDDYPEIKNQRFFGFKQLSLANNYQDPAGLRDSVVYELLAEAGLPSLHTAPYEIVLDYGEGPVRLGLYTMVEVVDDTGVPNTFGSDDGNIYEGEGLGASLAEQDSHLIEDSFQKKNNEKKGDWSDIWALYDALNSEKRTSDPAAWRADLEAVFDVDGFLEWLGIAAMVGHADTYGFAYHNFYLYDDPATGKLTWYSWDHNLTFRNDMRILLTLDKANVSDAWPLIRYLLADPVYKERYAKFVAENFGGVVAPEAVIAKIQAHAKLIAPYATLDMSLEGYDAAVQDVVDFVHARATEVEAFLK